MDEEKKPEASGEEPERLGPYLIREQVQQSHDSQVEFYLATHETSGATALVRKHSAEEVAAPRKDWRVLFGSWASRGYSAMEVEHTDWARALNRQSAESLLLTLEGVLKEVRRMARVVVGTHEPRRAAGTPDFDAWLSDTTPPGQTVLARPLPKEPLKGQKRPPCTRYTEVELVDACWAPHELKAPCPETLFEYQGKCYLPSFSAKPPPSSLDQ